MKKLLLKSLVVAGVMTLCANQAFADIYLGLTRTAAYTISNGNAVLMPVTNNANSSTYYFFMSKAKNKVLIAYNAECAVQAKDKTTWVDIDILVNGVAVAPSNGDNALCTSKGDNQLNQWVSAVTNGIGPLKAGLNSVQVRARIKGWNTGERARLDDTSLVIMD